MSRARIIADLSGGFGIDSGALSFGTDKEITLTHDPDDGLILKHAATADDSFPELTFQTGDTDIAVNDLLGKINFQAPDEGAGTDAILVAGAIAAISEGDFSSSSNATSLIFQTGASETATTKMTLSSGGNLTVTGNVSVGGDLDVTGSLDMSDANLTNVGSIQLDSIAGDADSNTSITFSGSDVITFATNGNTAITLNASQILTLSGNMVIPNGGQIGSASDTDAIAIASNGQVTLTQTLIGTALDISGDIDVDGTTNLDVVDIDGAVDMASTLQVDGAITGSSTIQGTTITATTAFVPDASDGAALGTSSLEFSDLFLADGAVINFGDDQDVTLTHVADTGLLLNGTSQLQFNDASQNITAPSATVLDINATDEIELNATLVDVNANLDVSGTYTGAGLMTTGGNIVIPNDGNIGSAGDTDAMAISSSGVVTFSQNPVFPDGGVPIADLDIDGGTDIGADLTTSDLIVVDDGAGGTNRKAALSRVVTLVQANIDDPTALAIALG